MVGGSSLSIDQRARSPSCVFAVCVLILTACGNFQRSGSTRVDRLLLFLSPAATNAERTQGLTGFSGTLYCYRRDQAKSISIQDGQLEFQVYGGILNDTAPTSESSNGNTPSEVLRYDASELKSREVVFPIGVAYKFSNVRWDPSAVPAGDVTIIASFVSTSGEVVRTQPATLTAPK